MLNILLYLLVVVERVAQVLVDALIHPVLRLLVTTVVEITVVLHEIYILVYHVPYFFHSRAIESAVAQDLRQPSAVGHREEMQSIAEIRCCHLAFLNVVAVTLVYYYTVGNLHDTALDALEFVTCSC